MEEKPNQRDSNRIKRISAQDEKRPVQRKKTSPDSKKPKKKKGKNRTLIGRIFQIGLVVLLVLVLIYVVRNFGEGSKLNKKGLSAYNSADYESAYTYFSKAIEYDDKNSEYYMNQGMAQSDLKLYDDAMTSFNRALDLASGDKEIQIIHRSMGISLLYQGKYSDALESFDKALDGKESHFSATETDILFYKAETQDKAGQYVDAVMTYTQIVDQEKSADAYMLRGMEYVKVGDSTSAETDLREAIKKDKKNYEIYQALYQALMAQNKTSDAEAVLREALELGGSKGEALVHQGDIYVKLGDYASAEDVLKKALDKGEMKANLGYGELYTAQEKYSEALPYFETYVNAVTDDVEAYNEYGSCLMQMGEYSKAEAAFTKGVALNNRLLDRAISKNQISAAEHAGNWDKALEYIDVYLQKYSDDTDAAREKTFIQTRIR